MLSGTILCAEKIVLCRGVRLIDAQNHPNEYIRGATLRSLQKLKDAELLEPLIPLVRSCLVRHINAYLTNAHAARRTGAPSFICP
jgi:vesicle coat complex subunit